MDVCGLFLSCDRTDDHSGGQWHPGSVVHSTADLIGDQSSDPQLETGLEIGE